MIRNILYILWFAIIMSANSYAQTPTFTAGLTASVTVMQNSTMNPVNTQLTITDPDVGQTETWKTFNGPFHGFAPISTTATSTGGTLVPTGAWYTPLTGYTGKDSFRVYVTDGTLSDTIKVYVTVMPLPVAPCVRNIALLAGRGSPGSTGDNNPATGAALNSPTGVGVDAAGNVYLCMNNSNVRMVNTAGIITTVVGGGLYGYGGDGLAATAVAVKMKLLSDIKIDNAGNIYITDNGDHRIRKVNSAGIISTYAGTGVAGWSGDGGAATAATINAPGQMAFDAAGNLYFSETGSAVVRKITTAGVVSTVAGIGSPGYTGDGAAATAAQLSQPYGLAIDATGNMYIGDQGNKRIRKVSPAGIISSYAGTGFPGYTGDGSAATAANIDNPYSIVADGLGNIFFSAANNTIRQIDASGIITTIAGDGTAGYSGDGGPATGATFRDPVGLEIDKAGNIYVGDKNNYRVRKIGNNSAPIFTAGHTASVTVMQNSTANPVNTQMGVTDADAGQTVTWSLAGGPAHGTAAVAHTKVVAGGTMMPTGITYTPATGYSGLDSFKVLISDCTGGSDFMMMYVTVTPLPTGGCGSGGIITTIAGTGMAGYSGDGGPATAAKVNFAYGVAPDGLGNIYISDGVNFVIRKINSAGVISTIAGTGAPGNTGDGGPATAAKFSTTYGIAADASGNVFFNDFTNSVVRKINSAGIISTLAGGGVSLADGVPATNELLTGIYSICTDGAGNVYLTDASHYKIRKVDPAGIITTVAGTGVSGYSGDGGPATAAKIAGSSSVARDPAGNLYFTDQTSFKVRKVSASGIISNFAGNGTAGYSGDGSPATNAKINCYAVTTDAAGNVYISDKVKNIVRKVDAAGIITTVVGIGTTGYSGDGGPATAAEMNWPSYLNTDPAGNLYIADWMNHAIRMVSAGNTAPSFVGGHNQGLSVVQNSTGNAINTLMKVNDADAGQTENWTVILPPTHGTVSATFTTTSTGATLTPTGLFYTPTAGYVGNDSFKVQIADCGSTTDYTMVYVNVTPLTTASCWSTISTIAGNGIMGNTGDGGPAIAAALHDLGDLASDNLGNIYMTCHGDQTIRKISTSGIITTIAGTGAMAYGGDGGQATAASINLPTGIEVDATGNIYFADEYNYRVRKISPSGIISTIAGTGTGSFFGDGGPATAARLRPIYLALDGTGNTYIMDASNLRIRKIDALGNISTIAGTGTAGNSGDGGPATAAKIDVGQLMFDAGYLYVCNPGCIRRINLSSGIISTFAGTGVTGFAGDGVPATAALLDYAGGLVKDASGNIYFADNNRIRRIDPSGIIRTIAGKGTAGFSGDGGPQLAAEFDAATWLTMDPAGYLYVHDYLNYRIRKLGTNMTPYFTAGHNQSITMCPGTVKIDTQLAVMDGNTGQTNKWKLVTAPVHGTAVVAYTATTVNDTIIPTGLSYTPTTGYIGTDVLQVSIEDCGGVADTTIITITVGSVTSAGVITGPSAVCLGNTISLTNAVSGGVWSSSNTNVTISPTGVVTGMNMGTATISYTVAGTCGTPVAKGTVTVINMPGAISGPGNVCTGMTTALTDAVGGGLWSSSNTAVATAGAGSGIVFGVTAGTATISYTIGGVCGVNTTINVDPPLPAIKGPGKVCVGDVVTLSDSVTSGTWGTSSSFAFVNPITGDVLGISKGTGTITYSVSTGCIAVKSFTVNPNPGPITLTSSVMCYSDKGMYASNPDAGGIWTSWLVTVATGGYLTAYHSGSGLITYTLPTGCFTTAPITVNPLPGMITGTNKICEGQLSALTDTTFGGTWSTTDATVLVDIYSGGLYGVSPGTAVVTYQLPTTCFVVDTITVYPKPTAILGNLNVCPGNSTPLSDALPGGTWSISAGGYGSIDATTGVATGIMAGAATVTYTSGMGCSATAALTIWPLPSPFTVAGGGHFCAGGTGVHVSLTGSTGGIKYYLFNGSTLVDSMMGAGALLDYGPRTGGMYTIYAVNPLTQCGNTMTGSAMVIEYPILVPVVTIGTVPGDTVCEGASINFVAGVMNEGPSPAYQWKVNGIPVGTGTGAYSYVPVDGDLVGIEMTSSESCVAPATVYSFRTVSVVSPVTPTLTLTADPGVSIPEGATVTFTAKITSKTVAATYQWLKNATPIAGETNATYTASDIKNYDTISCRVWSGGFCSMTAIERLHMNVYKNDSGNNNTAVQVVTSTNAVIRVIPNPSRGAFTVTGALGITTEESVILELTDMIGRMMYKGDAAVKDGRINTEVELNNTIASGTYLLNVRSGAMHKVFHIIIEQ